MFCQHLSQNAFIVDNIFIYRQIMGESKVAIGRKGSFLGVIAIAALVFGAVLIISANHYDLKTKQGALGFTGKFAGWLWQLGKNTVRVIGYAIRLNWAPQGVNVTNVTKNLTRIK
ncbi:hypothetical protein COV21_04045 [Candidatus Woesearchaeota archaeon CG10_big_fil_rev_8_21_14_0_10_45_5]|nr:MAG: hypothetical protein COV21_04045 [Candidatus Woesearchaeota archaeon CG10_big_fil_rev_8_21_14_0_10_45_5]